MAAGAGGVVGVESDWVLQTSELEGDESSFLYGKLVYKNRNEACKLQEIEVLKYLSGDFIIKVAVLVKEDRSDRDEHLKFNQKIRERLKEYYKVRRLSDEPIDPRDEEILTYGQYPGGLERREGRFCLISGAVVWGHIVDDRFLNTFMGILEDFEPVNPAEFLASFKAQVTDLLSASHDTYTVGLVDTGQQEITHAQMLAMNPWERRELGRSRPDVLDRAVAEVAAAFRAIHVPSQGAGNPNVNRSDDSTGPGN